MRCGQGIRKERDGEWEGIGCKREEEVRQMRRAGQIYKGSRPSLFACLSHNADSLMSASLMLDFELEYMNMLQYDGWNSAAVMTSVSSSILAGLMSTMSVATEPVRCTTCQDAAHALKD